MNEPRIAEAHNITLHWATGNAIQLKTNGNQAKQNKTTQTTTTTKKLDLVLGACVKDDRLVFAVVRRSVQMDMQYQSALSQKPI